MINASAPGKLFLVGEYAVLEGAPAILAAVDRRAQVTADHATDGHWHVHAPDIGITALTLNTDGSLPDHITSAVRNRLRVFEAARNQAIEHIGKPAAPLAIHIDSHEFSRHGRKFGLGSSAAVTVCLIAALAGAAGRHLGHATLCRHAIAAHRNAQGGTGSGADVATSVYGGVIEYQADDIHAQPVWPAAVTALAVITGDGARTSGLVARVRDYAKRQPGQYGTDMAELMKLANSACGTMHDATAFLQLMHDYFEALQRLDAHAEAGIILPRHRQLAALAAKHSAVFKTSGAGGGDLGLVFVRSGTPARRLAAELTAAGTEILPLQFGAPGAKFG